MNMDLLISVDKLEPAPAGADPYQRQRQHIAGEISSQERAKR